MLQNVRADAHDHREDGSTWSTSSKKAPSERWHTSYSTAKRGGGGVMTPSRSGVLAAAAGNASAVGAAGTNGQLASDVRSAGINSCDRKSITFHGVSSGICPSDVHTACTRLADSRMNLINSPSFDRASKYRDIIMPIASFGAPLFFALLLFFASFFFGLFLSFFFLVVCALGWLMTVGGLMVVVGGGERGTGAVDWLTGFSQAFAKLVGVKSAG